MTEELRVHPGVVVLSERGCRWAGSLLASRLDFHLENEGNMEDYWLGEQHKQLYSRSF